MAVKQLQELLPKARVVYCSATGASEPRHLGYMIRLGLWGEGNLSFTSFKEFLDGLGSRGMAALELVAMDMKARGMYVSRSLSYANCTFDTLQTELEPTFRETYNMYFPPPPSVIRVHTHTDTHTDTHTHTHS
jgi:hypothetical protein